MEAKKYKKTSVHVEDYYAHILTELRKGVVVTTAHGERVNLMTISWGALGVEWNKPIFTTFVRQGRFTHDLLEASGEFTVGIPLVRDKRTAEILGFAGKTSGRDADKVAVMNLHTVASDNVGAPGIAELPLTLECRVVYKRDQELSELTPELLKHYPQDVESYFYGSNRDPHTAYLGEILGAYVIEEEL